MTDSKIATGLGSKESDAVLNRLSKAFQERIRQWAVRRDMWQSSSFTTWIDHYDTTPDHDAPCVFLLCCDGSLSQLFNDYAPRKVFAEFRALVDESEFHWDLMDGGTVGFWAKDDDLRRAYADMLSWQWSSSLIAPDYSLIHESIFRYFSDQGMPALLKLKPREFEIYLESIFKNRGYRTQLGPGGNDGGIDIRLYSSDITGDVLTLVQAKRYSPKYAIRLDAVKALAATVDYEPAENGLFVTTSRFLPGARKFAERKAPHIKLISGADLLQISDKAAKDVSAKRRELIHPANVAKLILHKVDGQLDGQILHASTGYGSPANSFALCLKSTAGAALLCPIPKKYVNEKVRYTTGYEVPEFGQPNVSGLKVDDVFMAKRSRHSTKGETMLWGNRQLYSVWDGTPKFFDLND